jgi:hypothetical protein
MLRETKLKKKKRLRNSINYQKRYRIIFRWDDGGERSQGLNFRIFCAAARLSVVSPEHLGVESGCERVDRFVLCVMNKRNINSSGGVPQQFKARRDPN